MIEEQPVLPDLRGHFGVFGGQFVSETLMHALDELRDAYGRWRQDEEFVQRMDEDLAHHMGKKRVIAETGAGQHGVATTTVAARLNQTCQVYMGNVECDTLPDALVEALSHAGSKQDACAVATAFVAPVRESLDNMC